MRKIVAMLRLTQLTTLLIGTRAKDSSVSTSNTLLSSQGDLFLPMSVTVWPQSATTSNDLGQPEVTDIPQKVSASQAQTSSNVQSKKPPTSLKPTLVTTTATTRATRSTPTATMKAAKTNKVMMSLPVLPGREDNTVYDTTPVKSDISPFTSEASLTDDGGPGGTGARGTAVFWWQVAAAHYEYCGHACNTSDLLRRSWATNHYCEKCRCDDVCLVYGDCCPDVYARSGSYDREKYSSWGIQCSATSFGSRSPSRGEYVMVTRCPGGIDGGGIGDVGHEALKLGCETNSTSHWSLTQPVTERGSFVTYRNRYCALCNGHSASASDLVPWEPSVVVRDPAYVTGVTTSEKLYKAVLSDPVNTVGYDSPESVGEHVRKCHEGVVDRCNVTGNWMNYDVRVETACQLVVAPVWFRFQIYKNVFCLLCNTRLTWDRRSCRDTTCNLGKTTRKQDDAMTCQSSPRSTNLYGYKVCLQDISTATREQLQNALSSVDPRRLEQHSWPGLDQPLMYSRGDVHGVRLSGQGRQQGPAGKDDGGLGFAYLYAIRMFFQHPVDRDRVDRLMLASLDDLSERLEKALKDLPVIATSDNNNNGSNSTRPRLAPTCDPLAFRALVMGATTVGDAAEGDVRLEVPSPTFDKNGLTVLAASAVYLPLANTLMCPYVEVGWGDFIYDPGRNEIIITKSSETSSAGYRIGFPDFLIVDLNRTFVCVDEYRKIKGNDDKKRTERGKTQLKKNKGHDRSDPLYWVALLSTAVSLFFSLVSSVIYCLVSSLRTVAGINNLVLTLAMFSAQLCSQIASEVPLADWLCQAVGVATHFSWLAVAFAQNACTFHMFYTLSFPLASRAATRNPALMTRKYVTYVLVASAASVAATVSWQLAAEGHSGYGGPACYIAEPLVRIATFAAPLAGTVVANAAMFVFTIVRLRSVRHVHSTRCRRTGLVLHTKLSVLTGLTWLLGFLAVALDSLVLAYMFAVFQGCQGLFVFLAFLANRRVVALVTATLSGRKDGAGKKGKGSPTTGSPGTAAAKT